MTEISDLTRVVLANAGVPKAPNVCQCGCTRGCSANQWPQSWPQQHVMPCETGGDYLCELSPLVPKVRLPGILSTPEDAQRVIDQLEAADARIRSLHLFEVIDAKTKWDALEETRHLKYLCALWQRGYHDQKDGREVGWPWYGRHMP